MEGLGWGLFDRELESLNNLIVVINYCSLKQEVVGNINSTSGAYYDWLIQQKDPERKTSTFLVCNPESTTSCLERPLGEDPNCCQSPESSANPYCVFCNKYEEFVRHILLFECQFSYNVWMGMGCCKCLGIRGMHLGMCCLVILEN